MIDSILLVISCFHQENHPVWIFIKTIGKADGKDSTDIVECQLCKARMNQVTNDHVV